MKRASRGQRRPSPVVPATVRLRGIWINTARYSEVVRAFLDRYPGAIVRMDGRELTSGPDEWCVNRKIKSLRDFSMTDGGRVVLSFHDDPADLFAPEDQIDLVEELARRQLLRFKILPVKQ